MIKVVLFDLDGTLLPMDNEVFTKAYFKLLAKKLAPMGYDPEKLIDNIWAGTAAMVMNDNSCTNEDAFWKKFKEIYGERVEADKDVFFSFYQNEFQQAKASCGFSELSNAVVKKCKELGLKVALATNPIFPSIATESRMQWAGLDKNDFELYTTYENIGYSKPNVKYYQEVADRLGVKPEECLMVGNDVGEDMVAEKIGMKVYLLSNNVINKNNVDTSIYASGGFEDLMEYLINTIN